MGEITQEQITSAFCAGEKAYKKGDCKSNCSYPYEGELWQAWQWGYDNAHDTEELITYTIRKGNN